MARIPAPVAAVRTAVRQALTKSGGPVLVACSGGADSLALAAAAAFVAPRLGIRAGLVTVDHQLQQGSAERAMVVAEWARKVGLDPVSVETVDVGGRPGGPEAAAREARYAALTTAAARAGVETVLLGHTRDDQAETVLLALARGAGPRGLAGMPARRGIFLRPLLDASRADTREACAALGLTAWEDPHNRDSSYARARVRSSALPALTEVLGAGVVGNLARSASLIAADGDFLDGVANAALAASRGSMGLLVSELSGVHVAVRGRVLHAWCRELGVPGSALSHRHVAALDALITDWHGQGHTVLPSGIAVARRSGELVPVSL
ncbi:tRNA lysidine(34) synthetase TilS [Actinoplanes sp. TFC3]|uniref:tRNA lysidine(34) synthetase TilS n=1 Tax=Actinoplanes sp. TFC3 TaxID=1710355 RepID=UPI00082B14A6|nr:tRNA lysidine(34) synthetase TilS [Actinoplanes sp. TFC3]